MHSTNFYWLKQTTTPAIRSLSETWHWERDYNAKHIFRVPCCHLLFHFHTEHKPLLSVQVISLLKHHTWLISTTRRQLLQGTDGTDSFLPNTQMHKVAFDSNYKQTTSWSTSTGAPYPSSWITKKQILTLILYLNNLIAASERAVYQLHGTILCLPFFTSKGTLLKASAFFGGC